jgi:hypothetical protein
VTIQLEVFQSGRVNRNRQSIASSKLSKQLFMTVLEAKFKMSITVFSFTFRTSDYNIEEDAQFE